MRFDTNKRLKRIYSLNYLIEVKDKLYKVKI
jgi:hypothetical protein